MFRFFEKQVPPYPAQEPKVPPKGFFAFVWACTQGMRGWIGLMTLTSALLAAYEAVLFAIMGRVVDWLETRDDVDAKRIGLESMDTASACRTYNVLASEGRNVVAALLLA